MQLIPAAIVYKWAKYLVFFMHALFRYIKLKRTFFCTHLSIYLPLQTQHSSLSNMKVTQSQTGMWDESLQLPWQSWSVRHCVKQNVDAWWTCSKTALQEILWTKFKSFGIFSIPKCTKDLIEHMFLNHVITFMLNSEIWLV